MRLTITEEEALAIHKHFLEYTDFKNNKEKDIFKSIKEKIHNEIMKPVSEAKRNATKNAIKAKKEKSMKEIENALQRMILKNMKININTVSKESKIAYNTVKKYKWLLDTV